MPQESKTSFNDQTVGGQGDSIRNNWNRGLRPPQDFPLLPLLSLKSFILSHQVKPFPHIHIFSHMAPVVLYFTHPTTCKRLLSLSRISYLKKKKKQGRERLAQLSQAPTPGPISTDQQHKFSAQDGLEEAGWLAARKAFPRVNGPLEWPCWTR